MVGQNGWYVGRVQIPVSPGLRSVLVWILQGGSFLASYLNPPQMEMVGGRGLETHSKEEVRAPHEMCVPFWAGTAGRQTNFTLPGAASRSVSNEEFDLAGIPDSDFLVQARSQAEIVTPSKSTRFPGTWGLLWKTLALWFFIGRLRLSLLPHSVQAMLGGEPWLGKNE